MLNLKNLTLIVLSNQKLLKIVDDLFLDVGQGEAIGICGESGCGKSSLASGLLGIAPEPGVVTGRIEIEGVDLLDGIDQNVRLEAAKHRIRVNRAWAKGLEKRMRAMRGKVFGLLPQGAKTALSPFLTITEQLHKAYQKSGRPVGGAETLICDILCRLRLKPKADKHPHQLSGGEAQRVLIGQMIALNPEIAIFDEPTTGLDITLQVEIIDLLRDFKHGKLPGQDGKQRTVIVVSHDLRLIRQVAERVAVMYAGEMVEVGRCETIFTGGAAHPYTKKLIEAAQFRRSFPLPVIPGELPPLDQPPRGCKFYERCDRREVSCRAEKPPMKELGDGHWVRCPFWNRPPKTEGSSSEEILLLPLHRDQKVPLLSLRHLDFSYSPSVWEARQGRNRGSPRIRQKSMLTSAISALSFLPCLSRDRREPFALRGIDWEVYENESIALVGESACGKTTLGKVITGQLRPERGLVCWQGAPLQYTSVAIQQHRKRVQMIWQNPDASLNPGMKVSQLIQETILLRRGERLSSKNRASVEGEMRQYLARVKLLGREECYPETLSGGEQRRLSIARCLALEPKLIVADEPFSGLDASLANLLKNIFMGERVSGVTFVFILHDLKSAQQLCDRVVVIKDGMIVETDDVDRIFDDSLPHHPYTQNLLEASQLLGS